MQLIELMTLEETCYM